MVIKHILFDTDGVVVHSDMWGNEYSRISGTPKEVINTFFKNHFSDCALGKADLKEVLTPYLKDWKWQGSVEDYLEQWFQYENKPDLQVIQAVQKLQIQGIQCHLATNQEKYRLDFLRNQMKFGTIFDTIFCSAEIGYRKPQEEFYHYILHSLNIENSQQVLYFDDLEENIETAKALGIRGILYRDFSDLQKVLTI